jgi:hypothetical protein
LLVFTENHPFVLTSDADEILDEVDCLEDGVLFSPEHHANEIVLLLQLFVAFVVG